MSKKPIFNSKAFLAPAAAWLEKSGIRARVEPHLAQYRAMEAEKKKQLQTALVFCVIAANIMVVLAPMLTRTVDTLQKIQKIAGEATLARKDIGSRGQTVNTQTTAQDALDKTNERIFRSDQVHRFLDVLSDLARESQVSIESITPIPVKSSKADIPYPMPKGYATAGFEVIGTAGFHQLGELVTRLESSEDFVRVESLEILHELGSERRVHQVTLRFIVITRGQ